MGVTVPNAKGIERLTDRELRAWLKKSGGPRKLSDGGGLYLKRLPSGAATWRMNYKWGGVARTYSIGPVGLAEARKERRRVKAELAEGRDPVMERRVRVKFQQQSASNTLNAITEDWLKIRRPDWSAVHYTQSKASLEMHALQSLGKLAVASITPAMIAESVRPLAARSQDRVRKLLQHLNGIFRLAQARGHITVNPAEPVREEFPRRRDKGRRPALTDFAELGEVLRIWNAAPMMPATRLCHRLIAYTSVRLSNAVAADWKEFDLDSDLPSWTIPRHKMKMRHREFDHRVLLPPTLVVELKTWRTMTGGKGLLFASPTGRGSISLEAMSKQMRTLGFAGRHSIHGWRASFATLARDNGFSRDVVELALDHMHDTATARAYDRGERLTERIRLSHWWDSQLSAAQLGTDPLPLRLKA